MNFKVSFPLRERHFGQSQDCLATLLTIFAKLRKIAQKNLLLHLWLSSLYLPVSFVLLTQPGKYYLGDTTKQIEVFLMRKAQWHFCVLWQTVK